MIKDIDANFYYGFVMAIFVNKKNIYANFINLED